jgi:hypothetical protein
MSPWVQQLLLTVIPAFAGGMMLRPLIEDLFLRALTAGVLAASIATAGALLMGHGDPLLTRGLPVSLGIGFLVALVTGWAGKIKEP